ncbi:protein mono-ADP-ribosyltransferase PARP14-like [Octopus vulgaris]|uniref:Protein mono-ADP-ribosyltransferase PARP14-like n=1 Tax=Octopus vulgaris TaxID=6645 RepID=A0AA36AII2_OCTVU|nr:protein mono-ADP-ribosyltransferase PARP14-like [Octopus vulgaris]
MKETFVANTLDFVDKIKDTPHYGKWLTFVESLKEEFPDSHFIGENSLVAVDAVVNDIKSKIDNFKQSLTDESYISMTHAHFLFLKEFKEQEINDFGAKNKIKNVCLKDNKLHLKGTREQIRKKEIFIENLRKDTRSQEENFEMFRFQKTQKSEEGKSFLSEMQKEYESIISLNSDLESETEEILNFVYKNCEIVLREGDITTLDTDAIVNATNGRLNLMEGVAAAIVQKGGFGIQAECNRIMKERKSELTPGEVVSTKAGKLKCKAILHVVGPVWNDGQTEEIFHLSRAVRNCLAGLEEKSYTSIAIPAISTGTFGIPIEKGTECIVTTIKIYLDAYSNSKIKHICLIDEQKDVIRAFRHHLETVFGISKSRVVLDDCNIYDHILQNVKLDVQPLREPSEENTISRQQVHDYLLPSKFHLTFLKRHKIIVNDQLKKWAEVIWKDSKFNKLKLSYSEGNLKQIEQCLEDLLNSITVEIIDVPTNIFEDVARTLKSEDDEMYFYFDIQYHKVHIFGFDKSNVIKMKNRLLDNLRTIYEDDLSIHGRRILSGLRFFEQAERQAEDLQVRIHGNKVIFEGQYSELATCLKNMYKILQSIVKSELCLPLNTGMIINKKPVKEYLDEELRNKKCIGSWETGDGDSVLLYASDKTHLSLLEEIMKETFVANTLDFVDKIKDTPNYGKWMTFVESLKEEFPDSHFIGENSIVAVDAVVNDIKSKIDNFKQSLTDESYISMTHAHFLFLKEFKEQEINDFGAKNKIKNVCLKDNKLHLEGTREQIRKKEIFIENLRKDTRSQEENFEMFRFQKTQKSEEGKNFLSEMQKEYESIISLNSDLESETEEIVKVNYKNCEIVLREGDITTLDTDVIVNATNGRLNLMEGVAAVIVQKGGFGIQAESNRIMKERKSELKPGEVVSTKAGKLKCKAIIHAVGPVWNDGQTEEIFHLSRAVRNCLAGLEEMSYTSIAIPAISTGTFGIPIEEGTECIVTTIKIYLDAYSNSKIKHICLIDEQKDVIRAFRHHLETVFGISKSRGYPVRNYLSHDHQPESCDVVDVIINSTNEHLCLDIGVISKYILLAAGPEIQVECNQKYPQGTSSSNPSPLHPQQKAASVIPKTNVALTKNPGIKINLMIDSISNASVDVIINSTNKHLQLNIGAISKYILLAAGPEIQVECNQKYPQDDEDEEIEDNVFAGQKDVGVTLKFLAKYQNLDNAIETVKKEYNSLLTTEKIPFDVDLTEPRKLSLRNISRIHKIQISISETITIYGRHSHVKDAKISVQSLLMEFKETDEETLLKTMVQWSYFDENNPENVRMFSDKENAKLEKAYSLQKKFLDWNNRRYDFQKMTFQLGGSKFKMKRKQNLKDELIPNTWSTMENEELIKIVPVKNGPEYDDIKATFHQDLPSYRIIKIERIQNKTLYHGYQALKRKFEVENPNITNEVDGLWHGTAERSVEGINKSGFNRSYCGKNVMFMVSFCGLLSSNREDHASLAFSLQLFVHC